MRNLRLTPTAQPQSRKIYRRPELLSYGTLRELTTQASIIKNSDKNENNGHPNGRF